MNADQVKELLSNATPGPWEYYADTRPGIFTTLPDTPDKESYWYDDGYEDSDGNPAIRAYLCNFNKYYGPGNKGGNCHDAELMASVKDIAAFAIAQAAEIERLRAALERTRGELNSAMVSMDVSSALTRQYVYAAWDALSEVVWGSK